MQKRVMMVVSKPLHLISLLVHPPLKQTAHTSVTRHRAPPYTCDVIHTALVISITEAMCHERLSCLTVEYSHMRISCFSHL
ncbi:MAG: hypothetical protein MAG431_00625 [Chloroflexi bacterium]|nr:hypothetical protein [Chloroflexota bacterium]